MDKPIESRISEDQLSQLNEIEDPLRKELAVLQLKLLWGEIGFRERATLSMEEKDLIKRLDQLAEDIGPRRLQFSEQQMLGIMTGKHSTADVMPRLTSEQFALFEGVGEAIKNGSLPNEEKVRLLELVEEMKKPLMQ